MPHVGPILEGIGETDYERYLRVPELLELQKADGLLVHPEERLFQIMHQTAELWLKEIDFEMGRIEADLRVGESDRATGLLVRCTMILDLLREQIVILETMAPADYHVIRLSALGKGSGQESPGFRKLLGVGKRLWPLFTGLVEREGVTPIEIEREPRRYPVLFRLVQAMMDYDSAFMKWRYTHMRLAMRVIGSRVESLKGVPVTQLEIGTREALFPVLWETISDLTAEIRPEY
ncbi:MAG TPA: tryptophan 2,3-dioxygenase family protein [Thermoanaerobaculia bacterium]|nr:tryptophan 2,3-dioxygenase family protein [Thermoanaerobaculia bacterium]